MPKNCPHRIRIRRLTGCTDEYKFSGEYLCLLLDADKFSYVCTDRIHKKCYYPAMTQAERIKKLIEMGQLDLAPFLKHMD